MITPHLCLHWNYIWQQLLQSLQSVQGEVAWQAVLFLGEKVSKEKKPHRFPSLSCSLWPCYPNEFNELKQGTNLNVRNREYSNSSVVLTLIPVLINFPEDIDSISFLKGQLSVTNLFRSDAYNFTFNSSTSIVWELCTLELKRNVTTEHLKKKCHSCSALTRWLYHIKWNNSHLWIPGTICKLCRPVLHCDSKEVLPVISGALSIHRVCMQFWCLLDHLFRCCFYDMHLRGILLFFLKSVGKTIEYIPSLYGLLLPFCSRKAWHASAVSIFLPTELRRSMKNTGFSPFLILRACDMFNVGYKKRELSK